MEVTDLSLFEFLVNYQQMFVEINDRIEYEIEKEQERAVEDRYPEFMDTLMNYQNKIQRLRATNTEFADYLNAYKGQSPYSN